MRPATIIKIVLAAALILAVAAIAAAKSVNTERYKAVLADRVRAATGLNMVFNGPVKLRLGLSPRLSITGLGLSVPGSSAPLLQVDRIEARVGLLPLLFRQFRTERLLLIRPTLRLTPATAPAATAAIAAAAGIGLDRVHDDVVPATSFALGEVQLEDATLLWVTDASTPETRILLSQGRIRPESIEGGRLTLEGRGHWADTGFELTGIVGPADTRKRHRPFPVQLKGTISGTVVVARGSIADPLTGEGLDIVLDARGDELNDLLHRAGLLTTADGQTPPTIGPYKMAARLVGSVQAPALENIDAVLGKHDTLLLGARGSFASPLTGHGLDLALTAEADSLTGPGRLFGLDIATGGALRAGGKLTDSPTGGWRLSGIKATIGGNDLTGDLALTVQPKLTVNGKIAATSLSLSDLGLDPLRLLETVQTSPSRPAIPIVDERLLTNEPLALDRLGSIDVDLGITATSFPVGSISLTEAAATVRLTGGRLRIEGFTAKLGDGALSGEAMLDASDHTPIAAMKLSGSGLDLKRITSGFPFDGGRAELMVDLRAQGVSPRMLAGTLDGHILAGVNDTGLMASAAGGVPARLLTALDGGTGDEDPIHLRCAAVRIGVKNGLANAERGLAVETPRAAILGNGTLDLRTEMLDLVFAVRGGSAVRLRGGLAAPLVGGENTALRPFSQRPAATRPPVDPAPCRAVMGRR
ncbi:AsmA family protein [Magnetospirillum molischianum]|uniref:AsmA domain-containing protein n=1 Tax=Magnetospirillum molischianum DSM 120 TaxID=1150626 RepID=H8FRS0_MAGML|nr:AsmA family protein [Magnetospirillum molischianum]CCG41058.1 conserved exported hypothetical protein [Magnetospirillum molischianum DSM 120]